jgi:predicted AAA+ superfamily ATPase
MEDIIKQFEIGLKAHLESTYTIFDTQQDEIQKLDEIEKTVNDFVDTYLLETNLIAGDVSASIQRIVDEFVQSKIK